ncbi:MAG: amidohydrolase family protein [Candidatus Bathyarchaeia archaeon]|jgi:predicted TIM-barrel fold metal-dependent hydrolase
MKVISVAVKRERQDPSRRKFLKYGIATAGTVAVAGIAGISLFNSPRTQDQTTISSRSETKAITTAVTAPTTTASSTTAKHVYNKIEDMNGQLPLFNVHVHLIKAITPEDILAKMDRTGTSRVVLMPLHYNQDGGGGVDENYVYKFYEKDSERLIPFVGMQRDILRNPDIWLQPDKDSEVSNVLMTAESHMKKGIFKGIGEFILRHYGYTKGQDIMHDVDVPIDSPLFYKFLNLAQKYDVPVNIHLEAEEKTLASLENVLQSRPDAKIVWAHCGRADTATLRRLLGKSNNLYFDVAGMMATDDSLYGSNDPQFRKNPHEDGSGNLYPEWKKFYEDFADRIIGIGTDATHASGYQNNWDPRINRFRQLLLSLSESARTKIAYKNAEKLYLGMNW